MSFTYSLDRNNVAREGATQLPVEQAYVCKILGAKEVDYTTESGFRVHRLDIALDIIEGEYTGYYQQRFNDDTSEDKKWKGVVKLNIPKGDGTEQDGWTIRTFNTSLCNIEDSNPGYTWDNSLDHLKDKKIGLVLRNKEYEFNGNRGFYSEPFKLITVKNAQEQKFRKPATKFLSNSSVSSSNQAEGFVPVPDDGNPEGIPF